MAGEPDLVEVLKRGGRELVRASSLAEQAAGCDRTLVDVGAGDGLFPYRMARRDPELFCLGFDPAPAQMLDTAKKLGRKPARGGVGNLALMVCDIESYPEPLFGLADLVTVNFPWGALLRGIAGADPVVLDRLRRIARPGAAVELLINTHVFEDPDYRDRLELPPVEDNELADLVVSGLESAGLRVADSRFLAPDELPRRTTWGRKLAVGSGRRTLAVSAVAGPEEERSRP